MQRIIDGKVLREAIRVAGYTMAAFAKAIDVHRRTLYSYIEGKKTPSLRRLMRMAILLDLKTDELIVSEARAADTAGG